MPFIINREDSPSHLFNIPELDFSEDLFIERLSGPWFRLGAWTHKKLRDERRVEDMVFRQSFLLTSEDFSKIYDSLRSIGNVIGEIGKPGGSVLSEGNNKKYSYEPFHRFDFAFTSVSAEPLVFMLYEPGDTPF